MFNEGNLSAAEVIYRTILDRPQGAANRHFRAPSRNVGEFFSVVLKQDEWMECASPRS